MPEDKKQSITNVVGYMVLACRNYGLDKLKAVKPFTFVKLELIDDLPESGFEDTRIYNKILQDMDSVKRWYHSRIFIGCLRYGSILAFSQATKIPYRELRESYKDYKEYLKDWLKK